MSPSEPARFKARLVAKASVRYQVMTHKYRVSIVVLSISKSVKPNEEQKEMIIGF